MKHTRMQRHEEKIRVIAKRNKRIITFTTLVGLVCPATLGTIQALADETAPTTLEQPVEPTVQPTTEPVAETVTPEQPTEAPSQEPVTTEPVETATTEPEQTAPIEQVPEVAPTDSTPVQTQTTDQTTTPVTDVNIAEQAESRRIPGNEPEHIAKLQENWNKYLGLNQSDYTPESWATVFDERGWIGEYSPVLLADPDIRVPVYPADVVNMFWGWAFSELVLVESINTGTLEELGLDLSELRSLYAQVTAAIDKGDPLSGTSDYYTDASYLAFLSDVIDFWGNVPGILNGIYTREEVPALSEIVTLNVNAFKSGLSKLVVDTPPIVVSSELVGPTEVKAGETHKYSIKLTREDGTVAYEDIEGAAFVLLGLDPSDEIDGEGNITFGNVGTRNFSGQNFTGLTVTVTEATIPPTPEKTLTSINLVPIIGMSVDGNLATWSDFRVNLHYSDNTTDPVIPNATDYTFTTGNPNDVVTADGIIFNGVGDRVITVTYKGFSAQSGYRVAEDQGLKEDDLKEAIENGEDKISQGGWETTKDLEDAIQKGKDVLADDNRTQDDIDNATKQINDSIDALKKKDDGNNGGNGNNGGTGNAGNNGNNNGGNTGNSNNGAGNSGNQNGNGTGNNSGAGTGSNNQNGNGNKTGTNANNTSSKVVHTNTNTSSSNSNKDNLPQTGEETTITTALAGFAMVGLSVVAWIKRRRKA